MVRGIDLNHLPNTLHNAVVTTRNLGFRYLWVDALCIIQDSDEDKMREINNMGGIYRNSTITLYAARAETVHGGFSPEPPKDEKSILKLEVELPMGKSSKGSMTLTLPKNNDFNFLPVNQRGWTLQEYLLSPRMLAFGEEVAWMCARHQYLALVPSTICSSYVPYEKFHILQDLSPQRRTAAWNRIVENFCQRRFTKADDRILGITGIINMLVVAWQDECLFGLWKSRFLTHATWYANPVPGSKRSKRAPSWSWMSIDQKISHCRLLTTDAVVISTSARQIEMKARLLPLIEDATRLSPFSFLMDLHKNELAEDIACRPMYMLYLGEEFGTRCDLGLVVVREEAGEFRRVGLFEEQHRKVWATMAHQTLKLI